MSDTTVRGISFTYTCTQVNIKLRKIGFLHITEKHIHNLGQCHLKWNTSYCL